MKNGELGDEVDFESTQQHMTDNQTQIVNKPVYFTPSPKFLALDYILRWIWLGVWWIGWVDNTIFWTVNFLIIPIIVMFGMFHHEEKIRQKYNIPKGWASPKLEIKDTTTSMSFMLFVVFSGTIIFFELLKNLGWNLALVIPGTIVTFFGYGFYIVMLNVGSYGRLYQAEPSKLVDLAPRHEKGTPLTSAELQQTMAEMVLNIQHRLPENIFAEVKGIQTKVLNLLPEITNFDSSDPSIYTLRQIVLDYLPETLENYLNLPTEFITQSLEIEHGKTAQHLLIEQLGLLAQQVDKITKDFHHRKADRLLAQGRFLEEKFGEVDSLLD